MEIPVLSLFFADVATIIDDRVGDYFNSLPPATQAHVGRYTDENARKLSVCGMVLAWEMLRGMGYSLHDVRYDEWGKPVTDVGCGFNVAHSGSMVVCAGGADVQVGVDIEEVRSVGVALYREYFTVREWGRIESASDRTQAFYRMWVRKEAVLKAVGRGVMVPLQEVDACGDEVMCEGRFFYLKDVFVREGYVACVATDTPLGNIASQSFELLR